MLTRLGPNENDGACESVLYFGVLFLFFVLEVL